MTTILTALIVCAIPVFLILWSFWHNEEQGPTQTIKEVKINLPKTLEPNVLEKAFIHQFEAVVRDFVTPTVKIQYMSCGMGALALFHSEYEEYFENGILHPPMMPMFILQHNGGFDNIRLCGERIGALPTSSYGYNIHLDGDPHTFSGESYTIIHVMSVFKEIIEA